MSNHLKEEIANAMGDSSPAGGGNIAMPERKLENKTKPLRRILSRRGEQGSLFPNTKKKIGLDLPDEDFKGDLMKKSQAKQKERLYK